jgi:UDP-N-acetylglucosamine 2-epimerase (non-hydrolysing)
LGNRERVHLIPPVDYFQFLSLLRRCYLVLTDSGGVQEEAPIFHKPVLVLRKVTERPEASLLGMAKIVGTSREAIVREASRLLSNEFAYKAMAAGECPYGDGRAAARIATALSRWLRGEQPVLHESEQFQGAGSADQVVTCPDPLAGRTLTGQTIQVRNEELAGQAIEGRLTSYVNGPV